MNKHHKYGASGAHRWTNCFGSVQLSDKAPKPVESKYAIEGTNAHTCLETILKAHIAKKPVSTAIKFLEGTYPKKMVQTAKEVYERVIARMTPGAILLAETKVELPGVGFGTIDVGIIEEWGTLTVLDLKYGKGLIVDPENNIQALYYAIGLALKFDYAFEDVNIIIDQPRGYHKDGPVREWKTSVENLKDTHIALVEAVNECEKPNPKLKAGGWCQFCPASSICPEIRFKGLREAQDDFK